MSPLSSAIGMKSPGCTIPRVGCRQRRSASTPTTRCRREVDDGLVVEDEVAVDPGMAQLAEQLEPPEHDVVQRRRRRGRTAPSRSTSPGTSRGRPAGRAGRRRLPSAMPMLAVTKISTPAICVGARSASIRRACAAAPRSPAGSSAGRRARRTRRRRSGRRSPVGGSATRSLEPRSCSTASASRWPKRSLTALKSSMSSISTAASAAPSGRPRERLLDALLEERPVGKAREMVVKRLVAKALLGLLRSP